MSETKQCPGCGQPMKKREHGILRGPYLECVGDCHVREIMVSQKHYQELWFVKELTKRDTVIRKLVEAGSGYLGNGHEPTDSDVHQPQKCRQCRLEEALAYAKENLS